LAGTGIYYMTSHFGIAGMKKRYRGIIPQTRMFQVNIYIFKYFNRYIFKYFHRFIFIYLNMCTIKAHCLNEAMGLSQPVFNELIKLST
jgi:hypothetical protein